jgi:hypothetical protein
MLLPSDVAWHRPIPQCKWLNRNQPYFFNWEGIINWTNTCGGVNEKLWDRSLLHVVHHGIGTVECINASSHYSLQFMGPVSMNSSNWEWPSMPTWGRVVKLCSFRGTELAEWHTGGDSAWEWGYTLTSKMGEMTLRKCMATENTSGMSACLYCNVHCWDMLLLCLHGTRFFGYGMDGIICGALMWMT